MACGLMVFAAGAGRRVVAVPATQPGMTPAAEEIVPRETLRQMYRAELGSLSRPGADVS